MNINSISVLRAPFLHMHTAPIHIAYIIGLLRNSGIKVYYADYLDTPFYIFENSMKHYIIEILEDLSKKGIQLLPTELEGITERCILDIIIGATDFMRIAETYNLVNRAMVEQISNILITLLNSMIRKANISSADAVIIIPPSINTECTLSLIGLIREYEPDIPIIVMDYYNYDPSTPYLGVAITQRDFHGNAVGSIISQDPEYAFLTRFIRTNIDIIVYGEGYDFLQHLSEKGVERKKEVEIFYSRNIKLSKDHLILPDFSDMVHLYEGVQIELSRGCPYRCMFCERSVFMGSYRYYDLEFFREVIQHIMKYKKWKMIQITDTQINFNEEISEKYLKILKEENIPPAFAQIRVKKTTQRFFKLMKEANIEEVGIGMESGSENVLKSMRKYYPPDLLRELNEQLVEQEIATTYYVIIAYPTSKIEDEIKTIKLIEELSKINENILVIGSLYLPGYVQSLSIPLYERFGLEIIPIERILNDTVSYAITHPFITFSLVMHKGMRRREIESVLIEYHRTFRNIGIEHYIPPTLDQMVEKQID